MTERFHIFTKTAISLFIAVIITVSVSNSDAARIKQIIGFGDSITSGRPYYDIVGGGRQGYGGYEPVLEQLLSDAMRESYVYNWGYGGEDTRVGVNRIESVLNSQESDYVLIMEGTNDQWYGISVVTTAFNLGKMIDKCRAWGTIPILGNLTPADRDTSNQIPNIYNPAIADVAQQKDAIFVDHYSAVVDQWHELHWDSVHPNLEGYEEIAKTWYRTLVELINPPFNIGAIQLLLSD
jgi:lysophospholipase L1-like esterase